jgi:hypothetical protein
MPRRRIIHVNQEMVGIYVPPQPTLEDERLKLLTSSFCPIPHARRKALFNETHCPGCKKEL